MDREPIPPSPEFISGMNVRSGPMTTNVATIQAPDGTKAVVFRIESTNGSFVFPMDPDAAIRVGAALREQGRNAKSGLVVPQVLPPDPRFTGLS